MKNTKQTSRTDKSIFLGTLSRVPVVIVLLCAMAISAFAYFSFASTALVEDINAATYTMEVCDTATGEVIGGTYLCPQAENDLHTFTLTASGSASTGYCTVSIGEQQCTTVQIPPQQSITLSVQAKQGKEIVFTPSWGTSGACAAGEVDGLYGDGDTIVYNPFAGKTISIMGDSISTYTGWSDVHPITDESCRFRYGEAYYGPAGGDFHNTDMLVEDTWWHQAAQELGGEILMVNSGNSTGLLYASYPANADWQEYLQGMLAYKSRPYYLGKDGKDPDIIALYIGSNDVGKGVISEFGSIDQTDLTALIVENEDGTYTYAEPETVAESYCILLHKISVTYPDAEVYCFAVVPNAGGYLSTCNKRLSATYPFNEMIRGVADHYGATVVELLEAFELDPDGDGVVVQEDLDRFKSFYHEDPHPNAEGFDVITDCFVTTVRENSKYSE